MHMKNVTFLKFKHLIISCNFSVSLFVLNLAYFCCLHSVMFINLLLFLRIFHSFCFQHLGGFPMAHIKANAKALPTSQGSHFCWSVFPISTTSLSQLAHNFHN